MNILLTGSGGFIGKNLKQYLTDRYTILSPRSYELDLTDSAAVKTYFAEHGIDFIIHCGSVGGARGVLDKDSTIRDNMAMVKNLVEYKNSETGMILFGSGAMYGKDRTLHKVKEEDIGKYVPKDLYGQSKLKIAEYVNQNDNLLMLNIFACYGYGEKENRFPSYAINQAVKGEDIIINQNVVFDYLFVEDMEKIVEYFIKNKSDSKFINITPTDSISLKEIANQVIEICGKKICVKIINSDLNYEYTGDNAILRRNIPNIQFTKMYDGLKKLYEYNQKILLEG